MSDQPKRKSFRSSLEIKKEIADYEAKWDKYDDQPNRMLEKTNITAILERLGAELKGALILEEGTFVPIDDQIKNTEAQLDLLRVRIADAEKLVERLHHTEGDLVLKLDSLRKTKDAQNEKSANPS